MHTQKTRSARTVVHEWREASASVVRDSVQRCGADVDLRGLQRTLGGHLEDKCTLSEKSGENAAAYHGMCHARGDATLKIWNKQVDSGSNRPEEIT